MKLPQHLQHFPHAALIVTSDHMVAKLYLAGGEDLEEIDALAVPADTFSDIEKKFDSDVDDRPRLQHFIKQLAEKVEKLVRDHHIVYVHLVMPAEVMHRLTEHLTQETKGKIGRGLEHDLMNQPILQVVERLGQETLDR